MVFRPRGVITKKRLDVAIDLLEQLEDRDAHPFNRFSDLSKLDAIDIEFKTMFRFSLHRRLTYSKKSPVKSAIQVTSEAAIRVAKIHAVLTDYSPLKVRLFHDLDAAAKWLGVPVEALQLDPWANAQNRIADTENRKES